MDGTQFNPVSFIIGIVVGWFVAAFLHAAIVALFTNGWATLIEHFTRIAFFKDITAAVINLVIIIVIGIVSGFLWFRSR
jgi:hypothetical protein